jgi:hypothetical protein
MNLLLLDKEKETLRRSRSSNKNDRKEDEMKEVGNEVLSGGERCFHGFKTSLSDSIESLSLCSRLEFTSSTYTLSPFSCLSFSSASQSRSFSFILLILSKNQVTDFSLLRWFFRT